MSKNNHSDFIKKSITCILEEAVAASAGIGSGIETYPLCDYIMQSVFLKMTGFQEQKMKCIAWELATNDYEYRYKFSQSKLGECSHYDDKNKIYKDLVEQICNYESDFNARTIDKRKIRRGVVWYVKKLFLNTNLQIWGQEDFNEFQHICTSITNNHFVTDNDNLFAEVNNSISLKELYNNHLYKHRNRVAHNTQSYQQNLPTLKTLAREDYKYENYFIHFAVLVLIDEIFIELYKKYLKVLEDNI